MIPSQFFSRKDWLGRRRWYFNVRSPYNGKILCQSEAYNSPMARRKGFFALVRTIVMASGFIPSQGSAIAIEDEDAPWDSPVPDETSRS